MIAKPKKYKTTIFLDAEAKAIYDQKPRTFRLGKFVCEKLKESEE